MRLDDLVAHDLQHVGVELEQLGIIIDQKNRTHGITLAFSSA
jgi:hypothetical protein